MKLSERIAAAVCAAAASAMLLTVPAFAAATVEDVYQAMEDVGMPAGMIQDTRNQFPNMLHDENGMEMNGQYRSYDEWVALIHENGAAYVWAAIAEEMGVSPEKLADYYRKKYADQDDSPEKEKPAPFEPSVKPDKPFAEMTLEEKRAYVDSLPEDERVPFLGTLSPEERSSILRQLDPDRKRDIVAGMSDTADQMGMHVSVDDLSDGNLKISVRDSDGNLLDASSLGLSVDPTGWDMTVPVLCGGMMTLAAIGGLTWLGVRSRKQEATNG